MRVKNMQIDGRVNRMDLKGKGGKDIDAIGVI